MGIWKRVLAAAALLAALLAGSLFYSLYQKAAGKKTASRQFFAMDTVMSLQAYGKNAQAAVEAAQEEIERLDGLLSTGAADSEVSVVNAAGGGQLSEETEEIVRRALEVYAQTDGLFDITVYPLMRLWGFTTGDYHVPAEEELEAFLPLVDAGKLQLSGSGYLTLGSGQEMDLGGIAKGYTSARIAGLYKEYGVSSGLLSLGGNVQVVGAKPDGSLWRIGIRDPQGESDAYVGYVEAEDTAVITSGGYERYFEEDGQTYIHILNPHTGYPADGDLSSVTIVTPDGTLGDALSTALYLMGSGDACAYWRAHQEEFQMVLIRTDGTILVSQGLEESFITEQEYEIISYE